MSISLRSAARRPSTQLPLRQFLEASRTRFRNRYDRHYRDSYFHFWADLLLAGILVALAISILLLIFWKPETGLVLEGKVSSSRILSGQTQEFVIEYQNKEGRPVQAATLALDIPEHFIIENVLPQDHFDKGTKTFELGDLKEDEKGEIIITGIIQGAAGERQTLGFRAMYMLAELKKQVLGSVIYEIEGSVLEVNLEVPERAYANVAFDGHVQVTNNGRRDAESVEVIFPETSWDISVESPNFSEAERRLTIGTLKAGETVTTDFFATPKETGSFNWTITAGWKINDLFIPQSKLARVIQVDGPALGVQAVVSGTGVNPSAPALPLSLRFTSAAENQISNISFSVSSLHETFSLRDISVTDGEANVTGDRLSYQQPLGPGEQKTLEAMVHLSRDKTAVNDYVALKITVAYDLSGQHFEYPIISSNVKVSSNVSLESGGYYYGPQGDQLGLGPLPPKADIPTTYWIIWQVNNLGNDLDNAEVTAEIPDTVVWADQQSVSAGELSYAAMSRRVLWKVGTVAKTAGNYRVSFAVTIVPRNQDIGTTPALLSGITLTARDRFTGQIITKKSAIITTAIEADHRSTGKGTVESLE